jgi:hypothetical protein
MLAGPELTVDLIHATVEIEQIEPGDTRNVGTAFLIDDPTPDGRPRTVLVTAAHVLDAMPGPEMRVGWRFAEGKGWRYEPASVTIRDAASKPLWTRHPKQDIAVMALKAPPEFAKAAIPVAWLADASTFDTYSIGPGDEMMTLGFPRGLAANHEGFPILRSGRVASYPLSPLESVPTFLLDLKVFPGNSGGPVFMAEYGHRRPDTEHDSPPVIAGVLTRQLELEIGVVAHAQFVRETLQLLDAPPAQVGPAPAIGTSAIGTSATGASTPAMPTNDPR